MINLENYFLNRLSEFGTDKTLKIVARSTYSTIEFKLQNKITGIEVYYEWRDNLYNIQVIFPYNDRIYLTKYKIYKKYVRKRLKISSVKNDLFKHMDVLFSFLMENDSKLESKDDFMKILYKSKEGYKNIII